MERKKQRISDLFYDNRFLMAFSVLFALVAWLIVATEFSETQNIITDVPVEINYSNVNSNLGGLQLISDEEEYNVDVTIRGKRHIVESEDVKKDILVVADTSHVNSAGKFDLNLIVTSKSFRPEYEFVSVFPRTLNDITFDYFLEGPELKIEPKITFKGESVLEGYSMGEIVVSDVSKANFSGPATAVNKVARIEARAEIDGGLDETTSVEATLFAVDKNGDVVQDIKFNIATGKVFVKIPVYFEKDLQLTCSFTNTPTEYIGKDRFDYTVSPPVAKFGIFDKNIERNSIEFATKIDFSKLKEGDNPLEIPVTANEFPGAVLLDDKITKFDVTVHVNDVTSKKLTVSPENIINQNLPSDVNPVFSEFDFTEIVVIGPADKLELLDSETVTVIADFRGIEEFSSGQTISVPLTLYDGYCWMYGEYSAKYIVE